MDNTRLATLLADIGFDSIDIPGTDGGSILVTTAGARAVRVQGESGVDFLWLNKALSEGRPVEPIGDWFNLGGDRLWLAPEMGVSIQDMNVENPLSTYKLPKQVDPGGYAIRRVGEGASLASRFAIRCWPGQPEVEVAVEKTLRVTPNPFRHMLDAVHLAAAEYIGYEQVTTLGMISDPPTGARLGLWHIAQVPEGGEIIIPVTDSNPPCFFFGDTNDKRISKMPGQIRVRVESLGTVKIGIKAASVTGRVGYLKQDDGDAWSLVIRDFYVNPSGEYIDVPLDDLTDLGCAVQCYCGDGSLGPFGELEYHAPAIGDGTGLTCRTDISQLWAFRAGRATINEIARRLLATDIGI